MVAAATAPAPRRRGIHVGWLLLSAAVVGAAVGVGLAMKNLAKVEDELADSERLAARALPQGAPGQGLALPNQSTDPYLADAKSLAGIPPYPGALPRKLAAGSALAQKTPMAIAWFETVDSVDTVVAFYEKAYTEQKQLYVSHRFSDRVGYVSYLDPPVDPQANPMDGMMHLVTAMQQGQRTVVLVSALQPAKLLDTVQGLPDGVAFPPKATPVQLFDLSEGPQTHQTLSARVTETSVEDAAEFYGKHFERAGWTVTEVNSVRQGRKSLSAMKDATTQVVMIESRGPDVQVVVSYEQRGGTRRPAEPNR